MDCNKTSLIIESDIRSPLKEIKLENNLPEDECNTSQKSFVLFDMEKDTAKDSVALPTELNINETNENRGNKPAAVPVNPVKLNALSTADDLSDSIHNISSSVLNETVILNDTVKERVVDESSRLCEESNIVPCNVVEQPVDCLTDTTVVISTNEPNFDENVICIHTDILPCLDETITLDNSGSCKTLLDTTVSISSQVLIPVSCVTSNSLNTAPAIVPVSPDTKARMSEANTELNSDLSESSVASRLQVEPTATCTNEMGDVINQSDCFDKECDISNGPCDIKRLSVDNEQSFTKEKEDHTEMMERIAGVEAECEKYKLQVTDLKQQLSARETELAELKLKANKSAASTSDSSVQNEVKELKALVAKLESKQSEMQKKEAKLSDDLNNKTQAEMQISRVMEEYEKSISSLVAENEKMKTERDTAQMHLANIELAFSDVHQKYERCKTIVQGFKDNEESLKQNIAMNEETILKQEQKYETLKSHAMGQLEKSNQELAMMKKQHEQEMARLTAQLKRYEIKNNSLMEALQQKSKECEQLSAVCDEFIGNV